MINNGFPNRLFLFHSKIGPDSFQMGMESPHHTEFLSWGLQCHKFENEKMKMSLLKVNPQNVGFKFH